MTKIIIAHIDKNNKLLYLMLDLSLKYGYNRVNWRLW